MKHKLDFLVYKILLIGGIGLWVKLRYIAGSPFATVGWKVQRGESVFRAAPLCNLCIWGATERKGQRADFTEEARGFIKIKPRVKERKFTSNAPSEKWFSGWQPGRFGPAANFTVRPPPPHPSPPLRSNKKMRCLVNCPTHFRALLSLRVCGGAFTEKLAWRKKIILSDRISAQQIPRPLHPIACELRSLRLTCCTAAKWHYGGGRGSGGAAQVQGVYPAPARMGLCSLSADEWGTAARRRWYWCRNADTDKFLFFDAF